MNHTLRWIIAMAFLTVTICIVVWSDPSILSLKGSISPILPWNSLLWPQHCPQGTVYRPATRVCIRMPMQGSSPAAPSLPPSQPKERCRVIVFGLSNDTSRCSPPLYSGILIGCGKIGTAINSEELFSYYPKAGCTSAEELRAYAEEVCAERECGE